MELTVYRQASKERPDGTVIYKGEDALPFADDRVLLVADGLGGAAAIRHQTIRPELFDREQLIGTLFGDLWKTAPPEPLARYITDSFFELFAVRDCYTDNVNNIKKSGYFASRIVAAILLHDLIYDSFPIDDWITHLAESNETERAELLADAGSFWADEVGKALRRAAENGHLVYESAYTGLSLLGTTLCMTLFRETPDEVQAVYFTAGDSRPYLWEEHQGLCQLLLDEEGPDGGMTNYILANADTSFAIHCTYRAFPKPCVLFNASDGIFDSGYFSTPLALEKLLIDAALASASPQEMAQSLTETFKEYGRHDDSSTMAMRMFGYASFDDFKESARRRLEILDGTYLSKLPDILTTDYRALAAEATSEDATLKADLQEALFANYLHGYSRYLPDGSVQG